jgi:hypothetical protein
MACQRLSIHSIAYFFIFYFVNSKLNLAKKEKEEEIKQKKTETLRKLKLQLELHSLCRAVSKYPSITNNITRFDVPDDFVSFEVSIMGHRFSRVPMKLAHK